MVLLTDWRSPLTPAEEGRRHSPDQRNWSSCLTEQHFLFFPSISGVVYVKVTHGRDVSELLLHRKLSPLKASLLEPFPEIPSFTICSRTLVSRETAERGSDASSYNLFPSYPCVCFEKERKWRRKGGKEKKETNGPISLLKRRFSGSFIKRRRRIPSDWLRTRGIHHQPTDPPPIWRCHFG